MHYAIEMNTQTTELLPLSAESVAVLAGQGNEPAWLRAGREAAWATYDALPFPDSGKDEPWRRSNVRSLVRKLNQLTLAPAAPLVETLEELPDAIQSILRDPDKRGGLLVRRDNGVAYLELDEEYAEQGVIFTDMQTAVTEHGDLVRHFLHQTVRADEGKFQAMHAALMNGGAFLYVPKGVVLERALQVVHWVDSTDVILTPHTLIVVEEQAQATVIEEYLSDGTEGTVLVNNAVELNVHASAVLVYMALQNWGSNVTHLNFSRATTDANTNLNWTVGQFGAKFTRFQTELDMNGAGGSALLNGVFFPISGQHHGNYTLQHHKARQCSSDLLFKGAVRDRSRSVYEGGIKVAKGAQQTDAYQANRNLMLSKNAHADSIPGLEIEAHEVRCTHGSTTSQMDPEELFYLQTRGIQTEPATRLIVEGFFVPVLDRIPLREVRDRLKDAIHRKMEM
jgi:Fe-S cluster assembly protein SufD